MPTLLILIKASLLLAGTLVAARMLRRAPAVTRHALWSATFAALLALPILAAVGPSLSVPVPAAWLAALATPAGMPGLTTETPGPKTDMPGLKTDMSDLKTEMPGLKTDMPGLKTRPTRMPGLTTWPTFDSRSLAAAVGLIWLAGTLAASGALLLSLVRVRRLTRRASPVTDPAWRTAADDLSGRLGLRQPARVLVSDAVRTPMAGGVWRPLIFLPAEAPSWSEAQRTVVLAHELSHLAGRDPLRHLAARMAVACYWFHPLAWAAARQSSLAREQACDEAVLGLGIRPSDYARVLLDLAETMAPARPVAAALPMIDRSLLETRLMAILEHDRTSSRLRRSFVPAAAAALLTLTLAAAQPAAPHADTRISVPPTPASQAASAPSPWSVDSLVELAHLSGAAAQSMMDGECWSRSDGSFTGTTRGSGGVGLQIIQERFGDLRACMVAQGLKGDGDTRPSASAERASKAVIETMRGGSRISLTILRQGGSPPVTWRVNGTERPFDAAGQAWRDAVLAALDRSWEISSLRGEESSLRGDISSLRGEESSLRGEISSVMGEISSLRGEQSSLRGEESSLRGEIASIQGHVNSLRGDISSERGAISSLEASRYGLSEQERERLRAQVRVHEREIERIEKELQEYDTPAKIAEVEKQIRELDTNTRIAAIEKEIAAFGEAGKIAAIEKEIKALNVEGKAAEIERRIGALDVERRTRQLESQLEDVIKRLERALAAIK